MLDLKKMDEIKNEVAQLISERKRLKKELECCVSYIEKVYPSDGNFLLLKVDDATKRYNQLIEYGVVIRNRTTQPLCENCLRISVGICEENQRLIKSFKINTIKTILNLKRVLQLLKILKKDKMSEKSIIYRQRRNFSFRATSRLSIR